MSDIIRLIAAASLASAVLANGARAQDGASAGATSADSDRARGYGGLPDTRPLGSAGERMRPSGDLPPPPKIAPLTEPARDAPYGAASAIVRSPNMARLWAARAALLGPMGGPPDTVGRLYSYQLAKEKALELRADTPEEEADREAALAAAEALLADIAREPVAPQTVAAVDAALGISDGTTAHN